MRTPTEQARHEGSHGGEKRLRQGKIGALDFRNLPWNRPEPIVKKTAWRGHEDARYTGVTTISRENAHDISRVARPDAPHRRETGVHRRRDRRTRPSLPRRSLPQHSLAHAP